jgi:hypothetical protein
MAAVCEVAGCGVLAVGRCATCGRAMCVSHQAIVRGSPVPNRCTECQRGLEDDRLLISDRARLTHARHIDALAAMPPSVDRLVRALQYLAGVSFGRTAKTGPLRFEPIIPEFYGELAFICPEVWPRGAASVDLLHPPWDSTAIARWFLDRVRDTGKPHNAMLKGWVTTHFKWQGHHSELATPLPAWLFREGSLTHVTEDDPRIPKDRRCDAYVVVADARVMRTYDLPCELGTRALVLMANILWGPPPKPWEGG